MGRNLQQSLEACLYFQTPRVRNIPQLRVNSRKAQRLKAHTTSAQLIHAFQSDIRWYPKDTQLQGPLTSAAKPRDPSLTKSQAQGKAHMPNPVSRGCLQKTVLKLPQNGPARDHTFPRKVGLSSSAPICLAEPDRHKLTLMVRPASHPFPWKVGLPKCAMICLAEETGIN